MIRRKTTNAPEQIFDRLQTMVADAEELLSQRGIPIREEDLRRMKQQFSEGIDLLREQYENMEGRIREYWEDIEVQLKTYYEDLERRLRRKIKATDRSIRRHPYRSLGIAFGVGFIAGATAAMCGKR